MNLLRNNDGVAMVVALAFITALSVLAVVILRVASSEKRTAFNEYSYTRSFYSADAGGEAAINWLLVRNTPPDLLDNNNHVFVPAGYDTLQDDAKFRHDITYLRKRLRPGWSHNYKDFEYVIESDGTSVDKSESEIEVQALRLYKEGY